MSTYAIGDVHGCLYSLIDLMNKLPIEKQDKLIFLGDYIDRGPHSKEVVQFVKELTESGQAIALRGNHEQMCIDHFDGDTYWGRVWANNGGFDTMESYYPNVQMIELYNTEKFFIPKDHLEWMENLSFWYSDEKFVYVHGGLIPGILFADHGPDQEQEVLWIRNEFIVSEFDWGKRVVAGHTPVKHVIQNPNKILLDTACVYDRELTAMCMETGEIFSVPRHQKDKK